MKSGTRHIPGKTWAVVSTVLAIALMTTPLVSLPGCRSDTEGGVDRRQLAEDVRAEFLHSWKAYKAYAWGHDRLSPMSKTYYDWYGTPLGLTIVESFDTILLMGLTEEADTVHEYIVQNISFDKDLYVKNFEMTIRLLGGLISGYQMTGDKRLLDLAQDLGNRLLPAFESPTGMPYMFVNLRTGEVRGHISNPGEIGTLLLEYGALSRLTGDPVYYNTAKHALVQVYERRSPLGLVGQAINIETGEWTNPESHLSACIDSYYEYLYKCSILFDDADCKAMWETSVAAVHRYLADTTETGLWYGHANMNTGERTKRWFGALDAYFPAVLAASGQVKTAARLQASCMTMWNRHGIEPEQFDYGKMEAAGARFFLNPEIMESAYFLYKLTNDDQYLRMGKTLFDSLRTYCRFDVGYTEIHDVRTKERFDRMDGYFLAETLKYLYLLFAPPETLDFSAVVFNTEAHPIWRTW